MEVRTMKNTNLNVGQIIKTAPKEQVDISRISVPDYHDRTDVDDESIEALANNMSEVGQLNPILLNKRSENNYELISGLRRFEAAMKLNWSDITAIVFDDMNEESRILIMIAENAQRMDINDYDRVNALVHYLAVSTEKTDEEIKSFLFKLKNHDSGNVKSLSFDEKKQKKALEEALNKTDKYSLNHVINKLKVLNFAPSIIKAMKEHKLLYTYGVMLNKIKDEKIINELLNKFLSKQITKEELKKEIKKLTGSDANPPIVPFNNILRKLKDYPNFPEPTKQAISNKMKELESLLAA